MINLHRTWQSEVYLISAPSRAELLVRGRELQRFLGGAPDVDATDLAYTLNCSDRGLGDARLAIVATSPTELQRKLDSALHRLAQPDTTRLKERSGVYYFDSMLGREGKLAFVFPGTGAQYINMLADLCLHFPEVRAWFDLIDRSSSELGRDYFPSQVIFPPAGVAARAEAQRRLWLPDCGTEVVFAANQALLGLLTRLELRPDAVVGHSSGEYTALIAAGCLRADDSRRLIGQMLDLNAIYQRLQDAGQIPGGTLVTVGAANESAIREMVAQSTGKLFLAMDNCPQQLVLCATDAELAPALNALKDQGAICATLPFNLAYHTPLFAPYCDALDDFLGELEWEPATIDIYSCTTSQAFPRDPEALRRIVRDQWSRPVRFRETIETMYEAGVRVFVEAGPRGNLVSFIDNILQDRPHLAVPANVAQRSGILQLNHAIGLLAAHGIDMRLDALYAHRSPRRLGLEAGMAEPTPESTRARTRSPEMRLLTMMPVLSDDDICSLTALTAATPARDDVATNPEPTAPVAVTDAGQASARSAVIQRYLATMENFVAVQGDVIRAYLTGVTPEPASVPINPPSVPQPVTAAEVMAPPSIRQPAKSIPVEAADQPPATVLSRDDITKLLLRLVSARTGYPPDLLDPTLNLEADLGIDSIKRVEILGALRRETGLVRDGDMELGSALKTLGAMVDFLAANQTRTASPDPMLSGAVGRRDDGIAITRRIDPAEDLYLRDHTLGGIVSDTDHELTALPLVPLTMSIELMAEAATLLAPGQLVTAIEDVRAHRWIAVDAGPVDLRIVARPQPEMSTGRIAVQMHDVTARDGHTPGGLVVEGVVVLAGSYPEAPVPLSLDAAVRLEVPQAALYDGGMFGMFHGPAFQAVSAITRVGPDGMEALLIAPTGTRLFASDSKPSLLSDPVILDAAGQVVGFWAMRQLGRGCDLFPYRIKAVRFYGPPLPAGEAALCRAHNRVTGDSWTESDLDVLRADDSLYVRIEGWDDAHVAWSAGLQRMAAQPRTTLISEPLAVLPETAGIAVHLLADMPVEMLQASGGIGQSVLANLVLSRAEREQWRTMSGNSKCRHEWLLGRAAVKDAVRSLIADGGPPAILPADVEVIHGELRRPLVDGAWHDAIGAAPHVSMSHSDGVAVAAAARADLWDGVGIDLEVLGSRDDALDLAFTPSERQILDAVESPTRQEWSLRLWCAKEAVGKALGRGLAGRPEGFEATTLDQASGDICIAATGGFPRLPPRREAEYIIARTLRRGELIIAIALLPKGES